MRIPGGTAGKDGHRSEPLVSEQQDLLRVWIQNAALGAGVDVPAVPGPSRSGHQRGDQSKKSGRDELSGESWEFVGRLSIRVCLHVLSVAKETADLLGARLGSVLRWMSLGKPRRGPTGP